MATSAPIPAIRAAATWAWADKLEAAAFGNELMVCVGSAVSSVLVVLVLVVGVELVVFVLVEPVIEVVEVVEFGGVVEVDGIVVEVAGVVEVSVEFVGVVEVFVGVVVVGEIELGKVRVLEIEDVRTPVGEDLVAIVEDPNRGRGDSRPRLEYGFQGDQAHLPGSLWQALVAEGVT